MKRDNICIYVSRVSRARLEAIVADRNSRVLTDRGTEYCGRPESHEYELCLAIESIDHTRTKTRSPQTNGICERFHNTLLDESYRVAFRKRPYRTIAELQTDLDAWLAEYNETRPHRMADQRQALSAAKRRSPQL